MSANKKSYSEKLRDPRWQRKRLEIMQRDDFSCVLCLRKDKTLSIHHGYYEHGIDPWEYDSGSLWTLCVDCHEVVQGKLTGIHAHIGSMHPSMLDSALIMVLLAYGADPEMVRVHFPFESMLLSCFHERARRGCKENYLELESIHQRRPT